MKWLRRWVIGNMVAVTVLAEPACRDLKAIAGPDGYRWRDNRCEGTYESQVNSRDLTVVSFSSLQESFDPDSNATLTLTWVAPSSGDTQIVAADLRDRHYYRMDARTDAASFTWPTNILRNRSVRGRHLGLVAWSGSDDKRVYVPVMVDGSSRYRLLLLPGTELNEVFLSLYEVGSDGKKRRVIVEDQSLGAGYYPSRVAFPVELPAIAKGLYYAEVSATAQQKASVSCGFLFFSPGR